VTHTGRHNADENLAAELASGKTIRDAATAAGVSERTAHRRLEDPKFKARVRHLRSEILDTAAGRLIDGMTQATDVLRVLLTHYDADVRHKAAVKLLELAMKAVQATELAELRDTLEELEERINQPEKPINHAPLCAKVGGEADPDAIFNHKE
jgi:hypothetical protein